MRLLPFVLSLPLFINGLPPVQGAEPILLRDVTEKAGLRKPLVGIMGHGGAWGDVNGDGWIDLFVGGFADRPDDAYKPAPGPVPNALFLNQKNGTFRSAGQKSVTTYARTSGAVFADLDNNGYPELYVANNAKPRARNAKEPQRSARLQRCQLFRNEKGRLIDISKESGACPEGLHTARNIGVFDYDNDGLLDLFLVEDRFRRGSRSVLFRNKGKLRFEDVTAKTGLPDDIYGLGLAVADLNEDGQADFFVPHSNRLFFSQKNGTYKEDTSQKDVLGWKPLNNEDWPCGAAFCDLNRDGRLDLVLSIHGDRARNKIFLNTGVTNGRAVFRDVTQAAKMATPVPTKCPHVEI